MFLCYPDRDNIMTQKCSSLALILVTGTLIAAKPALEKPGAVREAVERGLRRVEKGAGNYVKNTNCFSCHHQYQAIAVLASAKKQGFKIDRGRLDEQVKFTLDTFRRVRVQITKGRGVPGGNTMAAYGLLALEQVGHAPDETTGALVEYLLQRQRPDGSWPALAKRPPSEGSPFTNAANALRALRHWAPAGDSKEAKTLRDRVDNAFTKGKDWLLKHEPKDTEDSAFHLRGLATVKANDARIEKARAKLLRQQNGDGSWSQLPSLKGDAYATGLVLTSLRASGLPTDHEAFRKGVQFLLKTQLPDGSWKVTTRSRPVQVFFDNGDPHGKSQFISFAATGWALQALLETTSPR
jgi:N-acyl-D-amino-acid deacylase